MSADVDHPILMNTDIKDILLNRLDFLASGRLEISDALPQNSLYKVLVPDDNRGSSSFGSPCTSSGRVATSCQSSLYESSTASSSPLSITKELTSVSSPLTPRSDVSRSKSKSPMRSIHHTFLSEKSKSPTPCLISNGVAPSSTPCTVLGERLGSVTLTTQTELVDDTKSERKRKKKKKHKKEKNKERFGVSPEDHDTSEDYNNSLSNNSLDDSMAVRTITASSSSDILDDSVSDRTLVAPNNGCCEDKIIENGSNMKTANGDAQQYVLDIVVPKVAPIRLKIKEPVRPQSIASIFNSPSPIKPKSVTIKLGKEVMSRSLVEYAASDGNDSESDECDEPCSSTSLLTKPLVTKTPVLMSPHRIIGPLKPSTEPLPIREIRKISTESIANEHRKNGNIDNASNDEPAVKRKRLLSERGEKEAAYPVMDKGIISHWNWNDFSVVKTRSKGVGLFNNSNDCFLNAILQVVTHTAPLCRYIWERHDAECVRPQGQCLCCAMKLHHLKRLFSGSNPFMASWIRPHLRKIFPSHIHGTQEDAHELLTLMLDAMDPPPGHNKNNGFPNGLNNKKPPSTAIEQIFGGTLRNQITCTSCSNSLINYERIRELNLAIRKRMDGEPTRISYLMDTYFRDENVSSFDCKKCARKTTASRRTRILRPPAVLMLQLKRFNAFGGKIRLPVCADMDVNLSRLMFDTSTSAPISYQYVLTAVVEHLGAGVDHGHYIAYSRGFDNKQWFLFDDEQVTTVSPGKVIGSQPYLLVYSRRQDLGLTAKAETSVTAVHKPLGIAAQQQLNIRQQNGQFGKQLNGRSNANRSFNTYSNNSYKSPVGGFGMKSKWRPTSF